MSQGQNTACNQIAGVSNSGDPALTFTYHFEIYKRIGSIKYQSDIQISAGSFMDWGFVRFHHKRYPLSTPCIFDLAICQRLYSVLRVVKLEAKQAHKWREGPSDIRIPTMIAARSNDLSSLAVTVQGRIRQSVQRRLFDHDSCMTKTTFCQNHLLISHIHCRQTSTQNAAITSQPKFHDLCLFTIGASNLHWLFHTAKNRIVPFRVSKINSEVPSQLSRLLWGKL